MIAITVSSEDPDEAARIANAIATAYRDYRIEMVRRQMGMGIQALMLEKQKREKEIKTKQEILEQLGKQLNLPASVLAEDQLSGGLLKSNHPAYFKARQELDELLAFHEALNIKIASVKVELRLPMISMVQIVGFAQPPTVPVSPNRPLDGALVSLGILLIAAGLFLRRQPRVAAS
jgi:hypothetical protein